MEPEGFYQTSVSYVGMLWAGIAYVGWYLLGAGVALFFAAPYLREKYSVWRHKKDEAEYAAKYHKNPDLLQERLQGLEKARQKMQEKYNVTAKTALEIEEERKEAKRRELLNLIGKQDGGRRLGTGEEGASTSKDSSSKLQSDYNPLMGDSSRGYRPPKRSCCGKGGCG